MKRKTGRERGRGGGLLVMQIIIIVIVGKKEQIRIIAIIIKDIDVVSAQGDR